MPAPRQYSWKDPDGVVRWHDHPAPNPMTKARWPIHSDALGCHESQIDQARTEAAARGVPTDFDSQGRAILRTPRHRRAYARLYGFHDKDGGYSDP